MAPAEPVVMARPLRFLLPALLLLCGALLYAVRASADSGVDDDPPGRVARVNLLDGHGSVQLAGSESWVDDLVNRPLTGGDKVWIESGARAEVHVGSAVLRLGASTALQFITLDDRTIRLRVTAGALSVRLRQLDTDEVFNIETPAGDIELMEPGGYRLDVADRDERARIAVWSGSARVQGEDGMQMLHTNESAEIFGGDQPGIEMAAAGATDSLDLWAEDRDRREDESRSARYVSRDVVGYETLDGYGDWVVDPIYGSVWVPQHLAYDWAPFRFGYWTWVGPWGWTWIDDAPWGFAPCHYGRWIHRGEGWGWVPGPVHGHRPIFAPALVAWVGARPDRYTDPRHAPRVGWVPLGYNEVYRPPYHASRNYLQNANASNTHLERGVLTRALDQMRDDDAHDGQRGQHRYMHQDVPGAVTTVSRDTFVSARPVGRNLLKPSTEELRGADVHTGPIDIKPGAQSFGRELPRDRPVSRPDRALFERPVLSSNPEVSPRGTPVRVPGTMPQRRLEVSDTPARAPARAPERPGVFTPRSAPPQQSSPPVRETPVRETPVREVPVREVPVREVPSTREIPPVREMPPPREQPQHREVPPPREAPPVNLPPPRPVQVTPRPTYTPQPPPPVQHTERPPPPPQSSPPPAHTHEDHADRADHGRGRYRD